MPLAAIVALSRTSTRTARGATVKVFGRDALLAAGDIPLAQFISWKVPIQRRPCRFPEPGTLPGILGGSDTSMASAGGAATGGMVTDCIVGLHGVAGPYQVMVDGQPLQYSDELWAYHTWDLGRVEVVYQRSAMGVDLFGGFRRPFAFVRLYTLAYLSHTAPRVTELCDHVSNADRIANLYLASLCGP